MISALMVGVGLWRISLFVRGYKARMVRILRVT